MAAMQLGVRLALGTLCEQAGSPDSPFVGLGVIGMGPCPQQKMGSHAGLQAPPLAGVAAKQMSCSPGLV